MMMMIDDKLLVNKCTSFAVRSYVTLYHDKVLNAILPRDTSNYLCSM